MPAADVYRALWRHRLMIVLLTAVAGVAAYLFTTTQPQVYQASALIRIQQRAAPGDAFGSVSSLELGRQLARTYARIVTTGSMGDRVARTLAGKVPRDDIEITAEPVGDVELLWISARSESPQVAAVVANATIAALREFIAETGTLRDQIVLVDRARAPSVPVLPRTTFTVAMAVLLALLFNAAVALAREFFADRLPEIDEWDAKFGRPVLATVPNLSFKARPSAPATRPGTRARGTVPRAETAEKVAAPSRWSVHSEGR